QQPPDRDGAGDLAPHRPEPARSIVPEGGRGLALRAGGAGHRTLGPRRPGRLSRRRRGATAPVGTGEASAREEREAGDLPHAGPAFGVPSAASPTSSARPLTPPFRNSRQSWLRTVKGEVPSTAAISRLL